MSTSKTELPEDILQFIQDEAEKYEKIGSHFSDDWIAGATSIANKYEPTVKELREQIALMEELDKGRAEVYEALLAENNSLKNKINLQSHY